MKSVKLILFSIVLMVLAAFTASATSVGFSSSSTLPIGGVNQDRLLVTNSLSLNYDDTNGTGTCVVDISTVPIGNDATAKSATEYVRYEAAGVIEAQSISVTLQPGVNSITMKTDIPDDFDAVDRTTLRETAFRTFDVKVTPNSACAATGATSVTRPTTVQAINQLIIDNVEVCTAQGCEDADDGDDVEDLKPGNELSVTIEAQNDFSDSDDSGDNVKDVDFQDVQLEIEIDDDDIDFDDDDDFDLDADDIQSSSFKFDIDLDAQDGSVDMEIRVYGTDDNGAFHGEKITIDLEIDRNTHDLIFRSATVRPNAITCDARSATVSYNLRNQGTRDEDDVRVTLSAPELNVFEEKAHEELDEDRSRTGTFTLNVPEDVAAGTYNLLLSSYYDVDSLSNEESLQLTVPECGAAMEDEEDMEDSMDEEPTPVVVQPPVTQPITQPRVTPTVRTDADEETSNPWYLIGIILAIVVVLIIIVVLIMTLVRGRGGDDLE